MAVAEEPKRNRRRSLLKQYYGVKDVEEQDGFDPYNINAPEFNSDLYSHKLLKEYNLHHLMQKEHQIYREIQSLDSEMQTLVYENYNKFISATDTIRKMKNDFKKMEEEMDHLSNRMGDITEFSGNISNTLKGRRQQISKLSSVHTLLKKLQFLFELPPRLKKCIENESFSQAVRYYLKAQMVLHQYEHMPSFHGIQEDCNKIIADLKSRLRERFKSKDATQKQLTECVDLLLQLQEPTEALCGEFLIHAKQKLDQDLNELTRHVKYISVDSSPKLEDKAADNSTATNEVAMDVLEYIDFSHSHFLSNLSLLIASYGDLFFHQRSAEEGIHSTEIPLKKLDNFVSEIMEKYFNVIEIRISAEKNSTDNAILVRALDRFYRRIQAVNKLLPNFDYTDIACRIISKAAKDRCDFYFGRLKQRFSDSLMNVRQSIAIPCKINQDGSNGLSDLLSEFESHISVDLKSVQEELQCFIQSDVTFAINLLFKETFCREFVHEGVVVAFLKHINDVCLEFCVNNGDRSSAPAQLILLLSRFCLNFEQSSICQVVSLVDEHFSVGVAENLTSVSDLCNKTKETAQVLLNHYVKVQGLSISQMLRKSVETRDWLNAIEPRNVRAVMKRVVEDITAIDSQVGQLYEEGIRKERSSDSSRRTYPSTGKPHRSKYNAYAPSTIDNSLMSNIQKLFLERIEIFSAVEFSKMSVMTGIIKISLKTFLECVRLRTFSKYGLQQAQVDIHYLQLYLWHFVADENLVHVLLDEIMSSTINRCLDPVLMEPSVVEVICERG